MSRFASEYGEYELAFTFATVYCYLIVYLQMLFHMSDSKSLYSNTTT